MSLKYHLYHKIYIYCFKCFQAKNTIRKKSQKLLTPTRVFIIFNYRFISNCTPGSFVFLPKLMRCPDAIVSTPNFSDPFLLCIDLYQALFLMVWTACKVHHFRLLYKEINYLWKADIGSVVVLWYFTFNYTFTKCECKNLDTFKRDSK